MEPLNVHELTAAYALDALDADEAAAYEAHLAQCERCRAELAELNGTAAALAWAAEGPAPPARLRAAILDAAAAERANVVPLRRRWAFRAVAAAAAVAACAAIGLGVWAGVLQSQRGGKELVSAVVAMDEQGRATLTVSGLHPAPAGKTYEAWVIPPGGRPKPAGLFAGGVRGMRLHARVQHGAVVAATLEAAGGASAPTSEPMFAVQA